MLKLYYSYLVVIFHVKQRVERRKNQDPVDKNKIIQMTRDQSLDVFGEVLGFFKLLNKKKSYSASTKFRAGISRSRISD